MKAKSPSAVRFFFKHAGYSYNSEIESRTQGRWRCARDLAKAEAFAKARGWTARWEEDWRIGSHREFYGKDSVYAAREPTTCESCVLQDADGDVLESLGCVDDASPEYRRVVEADLASEAMHRLEHRLEAEANAAGDVPMPESEVRP